MRRTFFTSTCIAIALGVQLSALRATAQPRSPTKGEVTRVLHALVRQTPAERQRAIGTLLERLLHGYDDRVVSFAFDKLTATFRSTQYVEILVAMDHARIDAGFANHACVAYGVMFHVPAFIQRYRADHRPLMRCIGLTFRDEDEILWRLSHDGARKPRQEPSNSGLDPTKTRNLQ